MKLQVIQLKITFNDKLISILTKFQYIHLILNKVYIFIETIKKKKF